MCIVTLGGKKRKASGSFTFQRDFSPFSGCSRHMHYGGKFKISSKYYGAFFHSLAETIYHKVVSSSTSWLVAHFQIFRRLMKGKFEAYVFQN